MSDRYPSPQQFLDSARAPQRQWAKSFLRLEPSHPKRVLIPAEQAFSGRNFFDSHTIASVKQRFPKSFVPQKDGSPKPIIADALRSEHIPFNIFSPLIKSIGTEPLNSFLADLASTPISSVDQILFEHAPKNAVAVLQDNTSFDACILASHAQRNIVIGIEVKYTEGPYAWGATEKIRMFDEGSPYVSVSQECDEFAADAYKHLRTRHLKQQWRNFLLAILTARVDDLDAVYIHLYPESNIYQSSACDSFKLHLTASGRSRFQPCTYERFLSLAEKHLPQGYGNWVQYLTDRYVV